MWLKLRIPVLMEGAAAQPIQGVLPTKEPEVHQPLLIVIPIEGELTGQEVTTQTQIARIQIPISEEIPINKTIIRVKGIIRTEALVHQDHVLPVIHQVAVQVEVGAAAAVLSHRVRVHDQKAEATNLNYN